MTRRDDWRRDRFWGGDIARARFAADPFFQVPDPRRPPVGPAPVVPAPVLPPVLPPVGETPAEELAVLVEIRKQFEHIASILQLTHGRGLTDQEVRDQRIAVRRIGGLARTYEMPPVYPAGTVLVFPWVANGFELFSNGGVIEFIVFGRVPPTAAQIADPIIDGVRRLPRPAPGVEFSLPRFAALRERVRALGGERVSALWFVADASWVEVNIW